MEIVLSLLRTLAFVVATVAATVYVARRIGRGRPLLWTGTTLLALYWLVLFGWTAYVAGSTSPNADLAIWVGWLGHLLPFVAALTYIWGIGQAAGFPSRAGADAGSRFGRRAPEPVAPPSGASAEPASTTPASDAGATPAVGTSTAGTHDAGASGTVNPAGGTGSAPAVGAASGSTASTSATPPSAAKPKPALPFAGPHAVPVVTTPSAGSHHSPADPPKTRGAK